jgi:hypothetical protein
VAAGAAAATEENPTEDGKIFPPCQGAFAVAAVGARADDALFLGKTGEEDVEEAAEGQAQERGEDGAGELKLARYFGRLLRFDEDDSTSAAAHFICSVVFVTVRREHTCTIVT